MSDFLEQLFAERAADVAAARLATPEAGLLARARDNVWSRTHLPHRRGEPFLVGETDAFGHALHAARRAGRMAVIAEVKRTSPALGGLAASGFSPAMQARRYAAAGATAISVLTEPRHWHGSLDDLSAVRAAVDLPILCKDVVVDEYQIAQARAAGADAVLLIAEALDDATLRRFVGRAYALTMGVLIEAHEPAAFGRAVAAASVVGVNARDLRRPADIDPGRVRLLHTFARPGQVLVAESGIASLDDARLLPARVDAVLVGTALMRAADPAPLIAGLAALRSRDRGTEPRVEEIG